MGHKRESEKWRNHSQITRLVATTFQEDTSQLQKDPPICSKEAVT